jgi:hypothetical protein
MSKKSRVQRPKGELKAELSEQLQLLRHSCEAFDRGLEAAGKLIALSIRVLIHEHGQSRALLNQVGIRPNYFLDSAGPLNPANLLPELNLVLMESSTSGGRYRPLLVGGTPPVPMRQLRFQDWWNDPVFKDKQGRKFSRNNSLGWTFGRGDVIQAFAGRPELAAMRQIAHEVLSTINRFVPEFEPESEPVIPTPIG